jgi:excisionase family DNA binding protein
MDAREDPSAGESPFLESFNREVGRLKNELQCVRTIDVLFLAFLRPLSRFGYFTLGPITIDVDLIEDIVERTKIPGDWNGAPQDFVKFSRLAMEEVRRSGRKRVDELAYLLAFMHYGEGLPARVFGELGVTPEQLIESLKESGTGVAPRLDQLMTPEEVADYLKVHVRTVRAWIHSGRLPARRVAGLRALRVRAEDVATLLRPLDEAEDDRPEHPPP